MREFLIIIFTLVLGINSALAYELVLPKEKKSIANTNYAFFVGKAGTNEAININDEKIYIAPNGAFAHSVKLKEGEKILIEAKGIDYMLVNALVKEAYAVGAIPFVELYDNRITRELLLGQTKEQAILRAKYDGFRMSEMDAYIGVRGGENCNELSDVPSSNMQIESEYYSHPVHHEIRVKKTKWVVLRYPNQGMAQQAGMSTDAFEEFYFNVCNLDYSKYVAKKENNTFKLFIKDNLFVSLDVKEEFNINFFYFKYEQV